MSAPPRASPPAEDVDAGRRVVRKCVQSIPILCKWKVSKGAARARYLCGDNAAPCVAQTMGLHQYRDGDSSCFRRYSDNLSLCILRFVSCGVNNQLRGAAHFKHVSFLHDMMAMPGEAQTDRLRLSENALILVFTQTVECLMCLTRVVASCL